MKTIDQWINGVTMYKLVLYELTVLLVVAGILGLFGLIPYQPQYITFSAVLLMGIAYAVNMLFSWAFDAPSNTDSSYITALILSLIISPPTSFVDTNYLTLAFWATACAIASKYIFAIHKKHIFNPAAFGVAAASLFLGQSASWWVGTAYMLPVVVLGGIFIIRKTRRFDVVLTFTGIVILVMTIPSLVAGRNLTTILSQVILDTSLAFFATVMLTEPMTMPGRHWRRVGFAALIGILFAPVTHIFSIYFTPELALLVGNIYAYIVGSKQKLVLKLREVIDLSPSAREFVFVSDWPIAFAAGQYMEWTLPHERHDRRGIRRFFTIASAPTDTAIKLGVKFYDQSSTYKTTLAHMQPGDSIVAGILAGDFTLPRNTTSKLVFIAGGIGITPFISMIREMLARGKNFSEKREIVLLYSNRSAGDIAYGDLLEQAREQLGMRILYVCDQADFTHKNMIKGRIDMELIEKTIPDFKDRTFYLSGPPTMVHSFKHSLHKAGISNRKIKTDFFPGLPGA